MYAHSPLVGDSHNFHYSSCYTADERHHKFTRRGMVCTGTVKLAFGPHLGYLHYSSPMSL